MEQTGKVVALDREYATVEIKRLSACDSCHKAESGCAVCSLMSAGSTHRARALNTVGAAVGDRVVLVADDSRILLYSVLVFILPLVLSAAAYATASLLGATTAICAVAVAAAFAASFVLLFFTLDRREKKQPKIRISRVLAEGESLDLSCGEDL